MFDIIVVGGGAAGMTAAISAAERGARVLLLEKNDRMGRKLAITGKGRCNVTNNCDLETLMENIPNNGRFLYGALSQWLPSDTMEFFESMGVPLKTERGQRVFPVSDKAADIVNALVGRLEQVGAETARGNVRSLIIDGGTCVGVNTFDRQIRAGSVILATGGASYPKTGSDGFGYRLAQQAGHTVVTPRPSLSALVTEEEWVRRAAGLTLRNADIRLLDGGRTIYRDFGEVMFTADGIGGATVLSASAHIPEMTQGRYSVTLDLKPALSEKQLDARILRDFAELGGGTFGQCLRKLLPRELAEIFPELTGIPADKKIGEINKSERKSLVNTLKFLKLNIKDFRPLAEAIVTRGGVKVGEIFPKTLESRLCKALFFAGELIDADAYTGGFNLQIAFATGRLAGISAANS